MSSSNPFDLALSKLGFDPQQLLAKYPSLIVCSISGYGQSGPYKLRAGHDINYLANAGVLGLADPPALPPAQIADLAGGALPAALQIIAALYHRQKNGGQGNIIDVSMTDCSYSLALIPHAVVKNTNLTLSYGRNVLNGGVPCYNVYRCKDGWISVGSLEPKFWKMLCLEVLNAKHLVSKGMSMGVQAEKVKKEVEAIFMTKTCEEWRPLIEKSDCCVEIIPTLEEAGKSKIIQARDLDVTVKVEDKQKGKVQTITVPKSPLNMLYGVEFQQKPGPAKIGQHNQEILSKL